MSTAETANLVTPSSGLGLQGTITTLENATSDVIPPDIEFEPLAGPDGRFIGEAPTKPPELPEQSLEIPEKPPAETSESQTQTSVKSEEMLKVGHLNTPGVPQLNKKEVHPEVEVIPTDTSDHVVDIVKQSKLKVGNGTKSAENESSEPRGAASRPITVTSFREGSKVTVTEPGHKKEKADTVSVDRDTRTPLSVYVERKPLHTAQTRSHSDYFSKASTTSRFTYIAASLGQFPGYGPDFEGKENFFRQAQQRSRRPPKLVRLATVTMEPKTKPAPRGPSLYYEEPKKPNKIITWDEANEARPPLRIDMEGPCPTTYSPRVKPLNETNSPSWTFGSKCFVEKEGGSRTSWEKTWFQSPNVWTNKVDFYNDSAWPTPTHYRQRTLLGPRQRTTLEAPSFSIGVRKEMTLNKAGSDKEPSPVDYDKDVADKVVMKKGPSFSHQFRRQGTIMWSSRDTTPGPGAYDPNTSFNKKHGPNFTIRSLRREKSHVLGPFSTF